MFIEHYVDVRRRSGEALVEALVRLGDLSGVPEVASAPLLLWGMSAGGELNYELTLWKPERVLAFVVNKGGICYSALAEKPARDVPGLFFVDENDLAFRNDIIRGIYSVNRRARSLWALVEEPGVAHEVARSLEMAATFYDEILALRLPPGAVRMRSLSIEGGFICDPVTETCAKGPQAVTGTYPTAWLVSQKLAAQWRAITTGDSSAARGVRLGAIDPDGRAWRPRHRRPSRT